MQNTNKNVYVLFIENHSAKLCRNDDSYDPINTPSMEFKNLTIWFEKIGLKREHIGYAIVEQIYGQVDLLLTEEQVKDFYNQNYNDGLFYFECVSAYMNRTYLNPNFEYPTECSNEMTNIINEMKSLDCVASVV